MLKHEGIDGMSQPLLSSLGAIGMKPAHYAMDSQLLRRKLGDTLGIKMPVTQEPSCSVSQPCSGHEQPDMPMLIGVDHLDGVGWVSRKTWGRDTETLECDAW